MRKTKAKVLRKSKIKDDTRTGTICLKKNKGITLVGLVVTIIVLLILSRSKYKFTIRRKWNNK